MRSKWAALLCLASMTISPVLPAMAQEVFVPYEDAGTATYDGSAVYTGAAPVGNAGGYLFFRKDFDNAIGYDDGYSSVGWFQPFEVMGANGFFGQGQIFVTDDGDVGGNLGGGWRTFVDSSNRVFGAYGFLDFDESARDNRYEQITLGVETLGQMWDFRLNGYFPLDDDAHFEGIRTLGGNPVFQGNNLVFLGTAFFEKPMPGADVEWGFPLLDPSAFGRLRTYFGGYVYDSEEKNPAGVRVRLESHVNEHVTLGAAFYHDDVNGGMATASLDIRGWSRSLPGLNNKTPSNEAKLYLPVVRNYRIAAETYVDDFSTPALDAGGNELDFVWVNNGNAPPGNGTFEDPFEAMPANAPGADYILVWQGPSSPANPVLGGITLEDGQRLYGEGFRFFIDVAGTRFGAGGAGAYAIDDLVPTWGVNGQRPTLSNPGGDVVTLASNNEVRSFNIVNSGGHGITGTGITDFDLRDLTFTGNAGAGIFLTNASGIGLVDNFAMLNNAGGGLRIQNTGVAPLTLTANGTTNPALQPNVVGGQIGLELLADGSDITATINDFFNTGSGTGAVLTALNGANLDVTIDQGSFDNAQVGDGMTVTGDNSNILFSLNDVTADGSVNGHGLNINLESSFFDGNVNSTVPGGSSFSGNGLNGVNLVANNSPGANELHFFRAVVDQNGTFGDPVDNDGLHIVLTNNTFFDVEFRNGSLQNNAGSAVFEDVSGGSTLDILINPSNLSNSGEDGVRIIANNGTIIHNIIDSTIDGSGQAGINGAGNGIYATLTGGAVVEFNMTNTTVNRSNEHGLLIEASGASSFTTPVNALAVPPLNGISNSSFIDNNLSGGAFDGIHVVAIDAGTIVDLDLFDTQVDNTIAGGGLHENALDFFVDAATFNFDAIDTGGVAMRNSSFSGAQADGILGIVQNGAAASILFDASPIDNSGAAGAGSGMNLTVNTASTLDVSVLNGSVSGSADHGILYDIADAGTFASLTVENSNVDGNLNGSGADITVDDGASFTGDIADSSFDGNDQNGLALTVTDTNAIGGTTAMLTAEGSTFGNNVNGSGLDLHVDLASSLTADLTETSASGNGADGVQLTADGAGTTATLNGDALVADNNDEDGFDIAVTGGAVLNSAFTGVNGQNSASGNGEDGFVLNVDASQATIAMEDFAADGNGTSAALGDGHGFNIVVANDGTLDLDITGGVSGSNNQLTGFFLTATGANTVINVDMTGANQFDGNGLQVPLPVDTGYGIFIDATGIATLDAVVGGASNNGAGGVRIDADTVGTITRIGVAGTAVPEEVTVSNNVLDGILIDILNSGGVGGVQLVTITDVAVDNNGDAGVIVRSTNSPITDILVTRNLITNNQGGDGLLFDLTDSPVTGAFEVSFNAVSDNVAGHGINFELNNSAIADLMITGNDQGNAFQAGTLDFSFDNLIWTTFMDNNGGSTFDIASVTIDISPVNQGWRPDLTPFVTEGFQPQNLSDVPVGLAAVNGTPVIAGTDPLQDAGMLILLNGGVPINSQVLTLDFTDFNPGEQLHYNLAHTLIGNNSLLGGNTLAGSIGTVTLDDGRTATGVFTAGGLNIVQAFGAVVPGISGNGLNGIRINATNGSDIAALTIDDNLIDGNGQHGIEIIADGSTLPDGTINPAATISGNDITNQVNGDGIRLVNPNTGGTPIAMDFTDNTITGNLAGAGINIQLDNQIEDDGVVDATADFIANFTDNTISNNGGPGVNIATPVTPTANALTLDLDFTGNTMDANTDAGIALTTGGTSVTDLQLFDNIITGTVNGPNPNLNGDGVSIRLFDTAQLNNFEADGNTFGEVGNGNAGRGLFIRMTQDTVSTGHLITNNTISGNNQGLVYHRFADAILDDVTIAGNTIEGNEQQGIDLMMDGDGALIIDFLIGGPTAADRNMIIGNGASGIRAAATANVELNLDIQNNEISDNELDGIQASAAFFAALTGTWSRNTMDGNDQDAIRMTLTQAGFMDVTIGGLTPADGNIISNSGRHGVSLFASNYASDSSTAMVAILNNDISLSETDGIHVNATGVVPATLDRTLVGVVVDNNDVFTSGRDGLHLEQHGFSQIVATADMNQFSGNGRDGAHFFADGGSDPDVEFPLTITELDVTLTNSRMENNERNGMFVNAAGDADVEVVATDNFYRFNDGRGIHVLNTGNADMVVEINGTVNPVPGMGVNPVNLVEDNGLQGILVENAAGVAGTDNDLDIYVTNTTIRGNGQLAVNPDDGNGLYLRAGTSSTGDMDAIIENNWFAGNLNIDFVTESFVSAPAPTPAAGASDPLARLDLRLRGNSMDEADVTRVGAFFSNSDPFQSQNSVFTSPTRQRNAQRENVDVFVDIGQVAAAPAPTTTTFTDDGSLGSAAAGFYVNNLLTFLNGANVGASRTVTAYTAARLITVNAAFGAAPAAGDDFRLDALDQAGLGPSTFRAEDASVLTNNTIRDTLISDFSTAIPLPGGSGLRAGFVFDTTFTWQAPVILPNPPFTP